MDFYLDDARAAERADIISLSKKNDPTSVEKLRGYVREGQSKSYHFFQAVRVVLSSDLSASMTGLNPQFAGLLRVSTVADNIPLGHGKPSLSVQPGDIIFNSFRNAQTNPVDFPDPYKVDPTRPRSAYQNQGAGFHLCPGINFAEQVSSTAVPLLRDAFFRV